MNRKLNPHPKAAAHRQQLPPGRRHSAPAYKMSVSAWAFARRTRFPAVQNARFSYGSWTPTPERGVAPKCSQPGGHFRRIYACFSLGRTHLSPPRQDQNPCTPPMMPKWGREQRGPARPRTGAAPCGRSFPARFWFTLHRRCWRTRRPPRPWRGERVDPDTQLLYRSGVPSAAARAPLPSSRRRVQKCPFQLGALHAVPVFPPYKNARFS